MVPRNRRQIAARNGKNRKKIRYEAKRFMTCDKCKKKKQAALMSGIVVASLCWSIS